MNRPNLESASGLRPASAYLMIGVALVLVFGKAWVLAHDAANKQPEGTEHEDFLPAPDFDILDRNSKPLALSVQRMDLRLSPRSMWQAHTPGDFADRLLPLLDGRFEKEELLQRFFPRSKAGVIRVDHQDWLLGYDEASKIGAWAHSLGIDESLWLVRDEERPLWRLHWRPVSLLSREVRLANSPPGKEMMPITWTRRLADGLAQARGYCRQDGDKAPTWSELEKRRSKIWNALLPCADTIAIRNLPPNRVLELIALLDSQTVQPQQMTIEFEHERVYPTRSDEECAQAFQVLGKWRYFGEAEARKIAEGEEVADAEVVARIKQLLTLKRPAKGLEGVAAAMLAKSDFDFIAPSPASYRYRNSNSVHQAGRRYYFEDEPEEATPRVLMTLDSELQPFLHETLRNTTEEHSAAASMAIVVDVQTGDVLAVDGYSSYEVAEFLPTWHLFSPGSTFKVIVMATALEAGVVAPDEMFNTYDGHYRVPNSTRVIHEAQGAPTGVIKAREGVSRSVNAVLVQIGMRVRDSYFHDKILALGYGSAPESGVGRESVRPVPSLPWKRAYTHASISFGHEISVNLWQHADALATVLRGGVRRPLRLVSGVEWGEEQYRLFLEEGSRVYSERTCELVRGMMGEGARTGTGRHISARENELGTPIELLSKTGTTEKEGGVACLHREFERNEHNSKLKGGSKNPDFITFKQMKQLPIPHKSSCYTSSICLVGRVSGSDREVMVLFVVDEPRSKVKFGSDVAGPAACAILKEALGLTVGGVPIAQRASFVQDYGYDREPEGTEHPWLGMVREDDEDYANYEGDADDEESTR